MGVGAQGAPRGEPQPTPRSAILCDILGGGEGLFSTATCGGAESTFSTAQEGTGVSSIEVRIVIGRVVYEICVLFADGSCVFSNILSSVLMSYCRLSILPSVSSESSV